MSKRTKPANPRANMTPLPHPPMSPEREAAWRAVTEPKPDTHDAKPPPRMRILGAVTHVQAVIDDGGTLRVVTLGPVSVAAVDLAKLPDLIELARAKAEHKLQQPTSEAP